MTVPIKALLDERDESIAQLTQSKQQLEGQVAWLNRQMFGKKSERYEDPNQSKLGFMADGKEEACSQEPDQASKPAELQTVTRRKPQRGKRQQIPEDLPRAERVYDLPEDQKTDPATVNRLRRSASWLPSSSALPPARSKSSGISVSSTLQPKKT